MADNDRGVRYAGRTNVVFVGNLSDEISEEQLAEIFSQVGPVVGAKLVLNRDKNDKSHNKGVHGYGFVEFHDPATASSAVRNLNGTEIKTSKRPIRLRVDHAEPDKKGIGRHGPSRPASGSDKFPPMNQSQRRALPAGITPPPGVTPSDSITQTLAIMQPRELLGILIDIKDLITSSPKDARDILLSEPQLTYALFQIMLMLGAVDASVLQRIIRGNSSSSASIPQSGAPDSSVSSSMYPPAPPQPIPQLAPAGPSSAPEYSQLPPQQDEQSMKQMQDIIELALNLTDDQIKRLSEEQQVAVLKIRQARAAMP